ncbi:MAG: hypothetical protein WC833_08675 [Bacteroidales bacterium]|jgi:hypothetical protein
MIVNGKLRYSVQSGGGQDVNNDPIPVVDSWSDPVDCAIKANANVNKGTYQDGKFTVASYEVLMEMRSFDSSRIELTDDRGRMLGVFQVLPQNIKFLDAVQRVKIIV